MCGTVSGDRSSELVNRLWVELWSRVTWEELWLWCVGSVNHGCSEYECQYDYMVSGMPNRVWVELRSEVSWVEVWSEAGRD